MGSYESKEALKEEIKKTYEKYILEFADIPESLKDKKISGTDRTPAENLAYQVGWTTLLLKWEEDSKQGLGVKTPSQNFKQNELGKLYEYFNAKCSHLPLQELKKLLDNNINKIHEMIGTMSHDELFKPHYRKWAEAATKTAVWEVYKFIHINTVAPFMTFRTKIRKWKKLQISFNHLTTLWFNQNCKTDSTAQLVDIAKYAIIII